MTSGQGHVLEQVLSTSILLLDFIHRAGLDPRSCQATLEYSDEKQVVAPAGWQDEIDLSYRTARGLRKGRLVFRVERRKFLVAGEPCW